jgi:DNA-binding MarR family transcriptional regulator
MPQPSIGSDRALAELALQLGRLAYSECALEGLTPAQLAALRYFSRANRFSRTVSAFADYHATTRATVSQMTNSLVEHGYLRRRRSARDGRSRRFDLTGRARRLLKKDPFESVVLAAQQLAPATRVRTVRCLRRILSELAAARGRAIFGFCEQCQYLQISDVASGETYTCGLLEAPLALEETLQLCVRFAAKRR